jgi:hypothetical protein
LTIHISKYLFILRVPEFILTLNDNGIYSTISKIPENLRSKSLVEEKEFREKYSYVTIRSELENILRV